MTNEPSVERRVVITMFPPVQNAEPDRALFLARTEERCGGQPTWFSANGSRYYLSTRQQDAPDGWMKGMQMWGLRDAEGVYSLIFCQFKSREEAEAWVAEDICVQTLTARAAPGASA